MRPSLLRRAAAPKAARASCQIRKPFSRFSAGKASLFGRPPCPTRPSPVASRCVVAHRAVISLYALPHRVARASCSGLAACKTCQPRCCAAPRRPKLPAPRASIANGSLKSPPAAPPCPAGRPPPPAPSPAASRRLVAHYVVISPRALLRRVARAPRCGFSACKDAARAVAPRRGVQMCTLPDCVARSSRNGPLTCTDAARVVAPRRGMRANVAHRSLYPPPATPPFPGPHVAQRRGVHRCPRRAPKSQTVLLILRRERLAAQRAALAQVFFHDALLRTTL